MSCAEEGCEKSAYHRGLCAAHYSRLIRHGSTADPRPTDEERFWKGAERGPDDRCWLWSRSLTEGYGQFVWSGGRGAHRFAYELLVGPIPVGLHLDHLCHTRDTSCLGGPSCVHRRCVNPSHLEPVTLTENVMRGAGPAATFARATSCVNGHLLAGTNVRLRPSGGRTCRACERQRRGVIRPAAATRTECPQGHAYDEANTYITPRGHRRCRACARRRQFAGEPSTIEQVTGPTVLAKLAEWIG